MKSTLNLLFVGMLLIILVACGDSVHENVNEDLASDSLQVWDILDYAVSNDILINDLDESDLSKLVGYQEKYYDNDYLFEVFTEVDEDIMTFTFGSMNRYSNSKLLDSDKTWLESNRKAVELMINQGTSYLELDR